MRDAMFHQAYPLALRSAQVRLSAAVVSGAVLVADRQDLEQEALTRVWQALARYDPARAGLRTFIELVVRTQLTSMLRSHPYGREFESLDEQYVAGEGGFLEIEVRADVRRVLADVSLFDRAVAFALTKCSASETSRRMGVSRAAVYRAIGRLRVAFRAAGFAVCRRPYVASCRKGDNRSKTGHREARP
jgi:RNA polymerase sigma factor (sigma-70 family)